jgi:hypothetical protein
MQGLILLELKKRLRRQARPYNFAFAFSLK